METLFRRLLEEELKKKEEKSKAVEQNALPRTVYKRKTSERSIIGTIACTTNDLGLEDRRVLTIQSASSR